MRSRSSERPSGSTFKETWQKCLHAGSGEPTGTELGVSALCCSPRLGSPLTSPAACGHAARGRSPDLALWKSWKTSRKTTPGRPSITGSPHTIIPSLWTQILLYAHVSTKTSSNQDTVLSGALAHNRNCNCKMRGKGKRHREQEGLRGAHKPPEIRGPWD